MSLIAELKEIPVAGVISFVDDSNKSIYVIFSNSAYTLFCATIHKLKRKSHDNKSLQDSFDNDRLTYNIHGSWDKDPGRVILRTEYERVVSNYLACGYSDMRPGYKAIGYKIKKYVLNDFRSPQGGIHPLIYVCGVSANTGTLALGIFDSIPLADEWIAITYGENTGSVIPVFAKNDLTQEYHSTKGYEVCRG